MNRSIRHIARYALTMSRLRYRNLRSNDSLLGDGPVVSLTTYGKRTERVYLTIESIGLGATKPQRIILWLDETAYLKHPPGSLKRLRRRGLEVRATHNYGPHKKYYPYVRSIAAHTAPMVTADDDVVYPPEWLGELMSAHRHHPDDVICQRARLVLVDNAHILPYTEWPMSNDASSNQNTIAIGVSGVLYPAPFLDQLRDQGDAFRAASPTADDLWLHVQALRGSRTVRQVHPRPSYYQGIGGSQTSALWTSNVNVGNDDVIARLYTADDIGRLTDRHAFTWATE
jgi:hypothetical protein